MTGQLSQSMQIPMSSRGSINAMPVTITSESSTSPVEFIMATVCKICKRTNKTAGSTLSQWRLPGPGPCWGGAGRVRLRTFPDLPAHCDMVRGLIGVRPTAASVLLGGPPLLVAGASSCRTVKPNGRPIPRFPSPRIASTPLLTSRSLYPLARRRGWTPCPSRSRRGRIGRDRSPIKWIARGLQTSKRSSWGFCPRLFMSWSLPGVLQKSLSGVSLTLGISGPHGKLTRGRRSPWKHGLRPNRRASTLPHRPSFLTWMDRGDQSLRTCILKQERPYAQTSAFSRSHAGPPPTSLIKLMPLMARRRPHCTPWQCCRFFKRSSCRRRRTELSLQRLWSICMRQRPWVSPWVLWSSFRGTFG